ncbi:MAG: SufE family protein [Moraxellaceae bacterium]|nr:MAG: SufE family protein [Moraxellaceae bacterium]
MFAFDDLSSVSLSELIATQNWQAQYRLITQWGKLIVIKPELRSVEYLLRGCETSAWLMHTQNNGVHRFAFDSDSRVINGLAALLLAQVDNKTTQEIHAVNFSQLLLDVGLEKHLTPSRNNGLGAIVLKVREFVRAE